MFWVPISYFCSKNHLFINMLSIIQAGLQFLLGQTETMTLPSSLHIEVELNESHYPIFQMGSDTSSAGDIFTSLRKKGFLWTHYWIISCLRAALCIIMEEILHVNVFSGGKMCSLWKYFIGCYKPKKQSSSNNYRITITMRESFVPNFRDAAPNSVWR